MIPALIVQAIQTYNKFKITKDIVELLAKKNVDKIDKVLTYVGGMPGKTLKFFKKRADVIRDANLSIAKNKQALANLISNAQSLGGNAMSTRYFRYNEERFLKNIAVSKNKRDHFVYNEIKRQVSNKIKNSIPGRSIALNAYDLAKLVYKRENWDKIAKKVGSLLNSLGSNDLSRLLNAINRTGNLNVTSNMYWKHISNNKDPQRPVIGPRGACALLRIQQYKTPLVKDLFDRTFYFEANSPETQNFSQELHSYNCLTNDYEIPIRGWFGKRVQRYTYKDIELNTILNTICRKLDAGHNYWNNYATIAAVLWAQIFGSYYGDKNNK